MFCLILQLFIARNRDPDAVTISGPGQKGSDLDLQMQEPSCSYQSYYTLPLESSNLVMVVRDLGEDEGREGLPDSGEEAE